MIADLDLTEVATSYDRAGIRPRRILMVVLVVFGILLLVAGAVLPFPQKTASQARPILLIGGSVIVVGALWGFRVIPQAATRLTISNSGVGFRRLDGRVFNLEWADPSARITIYDWTSIPPSGRSRGLGDVQFIVAPNFPVEAVVDRGTVRTLLREAESHGLTVTGWDDTPPPAGRSRIILVSHHR